jgi:fluoride exporter
MTNPSAASPFDVRPQVRRPSLKRRRPPWDISLVVGVGGALGSVARYALAAAWPAQADGFPWATFVTNVGGCLLIGVLMVLIVEVSVAHRLVRPFLGIGVLGGFTTFSTYTVQTQQLLQVDRALLALGYLLGTPVAALLAVQLGIVLTRLVTRRRVRQGG